MAVMYVSFHLPGYGPVAFEFDEVTYPAFVRLSAGSYVRFEDAAKDARILATLQRRARKRLDEWLTLDSLAAAAQDQPRQFAAYWWFITRVERFLARQEAVREAEAIMGLSSSDSAEATLLSDAEMYLELDAMGQAGVHHDDGHGIRRLTVEEVHRVFALDAEG